MFQMTFPPVSPSPTDLGAAVVGLAVPAPVALHVVEVQHLVRAHPPPGACHALGHHALHDDRDRKVHLDPLVGHVGCGLPPDLSAPWGEDMYMVLGTQTML